MKTNIYICPVCGGKLTDEARRAVCPAGHVFDRAKEGYINLLLRESGGVHGDNRQMLLSRKRFLESGYYDRLCEGICAAVTAHMPRGGVLLDEGAGEGFYTARMEQALSAAGCDAFVFGFDISKDAVKLAAKRSPRLHMAVAGMYHMPVADASVDVAVNLFAPLAAEETHRVLRTGGVFILAVPEREHLFSLKEVLYDTPYKNKVQDSTLDGFSLLSTEQICYDTTVQGRQALEDLLRMTPYGYRTPMAGYRRLAAYESLTVTVHVRIFIYKKEEKTTPAS